MITLHIARNGQNEGLSMLGESPHKFNTFNPYNTFFSPTEEEIEIVRELWNQAGEIYDREYEKYFVPQYLILLMCMMTHLKGINMIKVSYPECGVLPAVQSIFFIFSMLLHDKYGGDIYFYTLSEYMVRCSQVMFAKKYLNESSITVLDDINDGECITTQSIKEKLLNAHEYETNNFQINT